MRDINVVRNRSVDRAIDLLDTFTLEHPMLSIEDITKKTDLSKATAYRLLYTLETRGLIRYDPKNLRYSLGMKLLEYSGILNSDMHLKNISEELLIELQDNTHQSILMAVPDEDSMVYVFTRENPFGLRYSSYQGQRRLMNFGVMGKTFMAFADESKQERLLQYDMPKYTENTITDKDELRDVLKKVKREGYCAEYEETNAGVNGLSAPILNDQGECIAAISIVGPSVQFNGEEMEKAKHLLIQTVTKISERMGYSS